MPHDDMMKSAKDSPKADRPAFMVALGVDRVGRGAPASQPKMSAGKASDQLPEPLEDGLSDLVAKEGFDRDYWIRAAVEEFLSSKGVMSAEDGEEEPQPREMTERA